MKKEVEHCTGWQWNYEKSAQIILGLGKLKKEEIDRVRDMERNYCKTCYFYEDCNYVEVAG